MAKKKAPRFPEYDWYCARCKDCLSDQPEFDDNKFIWKCTNCGHKNSISKDNLMIPYAYLKDSSIPNVVLNFIVSILRFVFGFISRTSLYFFITALVLVYGLKTTTFEQLSWGIINPYTVDDYYNAALYCSGFVVIITLVLYAVSKIVFGRPNIKKHFIRETFHFIRDSIFYPINILQSIFSRSLIIDKIRAFFSLLVLITTIAFLVYGAINWL